MLLYFEAMDLGQINYIKLSLVDVSRSFWISAVEVCHKIRYGNFRGGLPGVVFVAIFLLLDEVLELSLVLAAIEDSFYLPLFLSINNYRGWQRLCSLTEYGIFGGSHQFYHVKD